MGIASKRAKLVTETLNGIKNIKTNAWEDMIKKKANDFRAREVTELRKFLNYTQSFDGLDLSLPIISVVLVIWLYTEYVGSLTVGDTVAMISFGNMIIIPSKIISFLLVYG